MELKLIFLDFDGVITGPRHKGGFFVPLERAVKHLNTIVKETDAKIIISSSWRHSWDISHISTLLEAVGFKGEVQGSLPFRGFESEVGGRGVLINRFLIRNFPVSGGLNTLKQYVILDDDGDMLAGQWPHFVQIEHPAMKPSIIIPKDAERAINILNSDIVPYIDWEDTDE